MKKRIGIIVWVIMLAFASIGVKGEINEDGLQNDKLNERGYMSATRLYINGEQVKFQDVETCIYNRYRIIQSIVYPSELEDIYVPLKAVAACLGASVGWDNVAKKPYIVDNGKKINLDKIRMDNNVSTIDLQSLKQALNLDITYDNSSNTADIITDRSVVKPRVKVAEQDIEKFGNQFIDKHVTKEDRYFYKDKVIIAKRSDFPINLGDEVIYDIRINGNISFPAVYSNKKSVIHKYHTYKKGETITLKVKQWRPSYFTETIYLSDEKGINRYRNQLLYLTAKGDTILGKLDQNDISTGIYAVVCSSDQRIFNDRYEGNDYLNFDITDMDYLIIRGQDALLAVPISELF